MMDEPLDPLHAECVSMTGFVRRHAAALASKVAEWAPGPMPDDWTPEPTMPYLRPARQAVTWSTAPPYLDVPTPLDHTPFLDELPRPKRRWFR